MLPGIGTVSRLVGILVMGVSLIATLYLQYARVHLIHLAMFAFWAWGSATYIWSINPDGAQTAVVSYFQIMVMMWLIYQWTTRPEQISFYLSAYVLGCYVSVGATIWAYIYNIESAYHRFAAAGFDPNDLAIIMSLGIPMAGYLAMESRNIFASWVYRAYPMLGLGVVFLTGSRTGFLVALLGCSYMVWSYRDLPLKSRIALPILGAVAAVLLLPYIPMDSLERIQTIGSSVSSGDLNYRTRIWYAALESLENAPDAGLILLRGVGWDGFPTLVTPYLGSPFVSHNAYLSVLMETGLVGFLLFGANLVMTIHFALQMPRRERLLWILLIAMWAIAATVLNWEFRKETWFLFILAVTHSSILPRYRGKTSDGEAVGNGIGGRPRDAVARP